MELGTLTGDGQALYNRQQAKIREMNKAVDARLAAGIDWAQKQARYRMALAGAVAKLRDGGMAAAIANTQAKGDKAVARREYEMEVARVKYDCLEDIINAAKKEIDILEGQIQREWGRRG